jgi:prepilin-type N-terminal cleavage/methylation domain-containing protein
MGTPYRTKSIAADASTVLSFRSLVIAKHGCPGPRGSTSKRDAGYTLVELLLTLALSVVLMALVGSALSFYATKLETRDSEVRRLQLAQAILNMLNDDLRVALYPPEFDDQALSDLLASAAGGGGEEQPGAGEDLSAAGLDDDSEGATDEAADLPTSESVETADISAGTLTTSRPGLIGNQTQIQFDISRLPRLEEYQRQMVGDTVGETLDIPSDIKTVSYFIQASGGGVTDPLDIVGQNSALSSGPAASQNMGGGLVRRSLDRAVTTYAMSTGGMTNLSATGDLLATEVVGLEFRYWDGLMWQMFWDSDASGSLPLAIEATLTMVEPSVGDDSQTEAPTTRQFQQIIRLPMGRPVDTSVDAGMSAVGL